MDNILPSQQGFLIAVASSVPAAGNEIQLTIPANQRWRIILAIATLITGVAVANRLVHLQFADATNAWMRIEAQVVQLAMTTKAYEFGSGIDAVAVAGGTFESMFFPCGLVTACWNHHNDGDR